ncbi:hypothetical protein QTP86_007804 [Hemibagrus guttatus]|nr:hypothetical protein QTP86_007804 [Hemibagrus guttatus]
MWIPTEQEKYGVGVAEKYVRVVQDMYERSRTVVRCAVGQTEEFKVEVGLHQGSALSPFLFAIVMDQLSEEVRQESPWTMMFADDIVICSESREQVEENLESWRFALERRGMKVSGSKTEYMCVNEREGSGTVRLQGEEVKKVQEFKYLGSTVQSNGECGKEVKKRVQAGWNGWRKVWGVLCERKISARIKGKVYRTVVRAAMLYGLETVSLRKRQESELEVAELKMLRFSLGVTRLDRIRDEYIRGTGHVGRLGDKVREDRLRWFGHVQRRETRGRHYSHRLIQDGDESAYRQEVEQLAAWCSLNNLELNTLRTVEMIVDFRRNTPALPPLTIMNSTVPTVESFRFLGTTISQDLKWDTHIDSIIKKVQQRLYFLQQLRKFNLPQELLTHFYSAVTESVLCTSITVWFGSATKSDIRRLQRTVRTAERIIGAPLPTLQEPYTSRVRKRAQKITLDPSHPGHLLFDLLPSVMWSEVVVRWSDVVVWGEVVVVWGEVVVVWGEVVVVWGEVVVVWSDVVVWGEVVWSDVVVWGEVVVVWGEVVVVWSDVVV